MFQNIYRKHSGKPLDITGMFFDNKSRRFGVKKKESGRRAKDLEKRDSSTKKT